MLNNRPPGSYKSGEYNAWDSMKQRCLNERCDAYAYYGGRGITIWRPWITSFAVFFADMGPRPSARHTLERANNSLGYSPENCHWADRAEQARNRRNNRYYTFNGKRQVAADWAREYGIAKNTLLHRLDSGMTIAQAIAGRNSCKNGHAFDGVNCRGHRTCSICARASEKRRRSRR